MFRQVHGKCKALMTINDELHLVQSWGMEHWILPQSTSPMGVPVKPRGITHKLNERIFPKSKKSSYCITQSWISFFWPKQSLWPKDYSISYHWSNHCSLKFEESLTGLLYREYVYSFADFSYSIWSFFPYELSDCLQFTFEICTNVFSLIEFHWKGFFVHTNYAYNFIRAFSYFLNS